VKVCGTEVREMPMRTSILAMPHKSRVLRKLHRVFTPDQVLYLLFFYLHDLTAETEGEQQMQATDIEQEIRSFLAENFLVGRSEALNDETPLLGNVINSTGVIELVLYIQERFTIAVGDEEVTTDNLGSVKNVVAFIEGKLRSKV
jgi:acyl carrier protein